MADYQAVSDNLIDSSWMLDFIGAVMGKALKTEDQFGNPLHPTHGLFESLGYLALEIVEIGRESRAVFTLSTVSAKIHRRRVIPVDLLPAVSLLFQSS